MSNKNFFHTWINIFKAKYKDIDFLKIKKNWNHLLKINSEIKNLNFDTDILFNLFTKNFFMAKKQKQIYCYDIEKMALDIHAVRLVYIDGKFFSQYSKNLDNNFYQIQILNALDFNFKNPICLDFFLYFTECYTEKITKIKILSNKFEKLPLYILHISSGHDKQCLNFTNYRHHIKIKSKSEIKIIEHYISLNNDAYHFTGSRITMELEKNTKIKHIKIASENTNSYHLAHNDINLSSNCQFYSHNFFLGAKILRHKTSIQINGENSNVVTNSIMMPLKDEICNSSSYIEHNKSYCNSRQVHKTLTHNQGKSIFHGLIKVGKNIIKIDANMINNNLLLGNNAWISAEPKLEIYSDDVKCSHGSTTGYIDPEQIFYLCSRGIDKIAAKKIIILAFFSSLIKNIDNNFIKKILLDKIYKRFSE